jgi:Peroxin-3
VVAAITAAKKYAEYKLGQFEEQAVTQQLALSRRRLNFETNQHHCDATIMTLLPNLAEEIYATLDTDRSDPLPSLFALLSYSCSH